jgi:hypothetical protein
LGSEGVRLVLHTQLHRVSAGIGRGGCTGEGGGIVAPYELSLGASRIASIHMPTT